MVSTFGGTTWQDSGNGFFKFAVKRALKLDEIVHMEGKLQVILYFSRECSGTMIIETLNFLYLHSALKLEKSAISKVQKFIFCNFKNGKKSIFEQEKSLKLAKMQFSDFFLVQKLIFCHF